MWGKAIIEDPLNIDGFNVMKVDGSKSAFTFKHLFSDTYYSFVVIPINNAGEGLWHISPKKERTETGKYKNSCFLPLNKPLFAFLLLLFLLLISLLLLLHVIFPYLLLMLMLLLLPLFICASPPFILLFHPLPPPFSPPPLPLPFTFQVHSNWICKIMWYWTHVNNQLVYVLIENMDW